MKIKNSLYNLSGKDNPLYKERIKKYCRVCGNEFEVIQSREKKYPAQYCSMKCWGRVLSVIKTKDKVKHICQYCTKEFETIKSIKKQLEVHHIKTFGSIIKKYNIKSSNEAKECAELWDINNGMTLCKKCHKRLSMKRTKNEGLQLNICYN